MSHRLLYHTELDRHRKYLLLLLITVANSVQPIMPSQLAQRRNSFSQFQVRFSQNGGIFPPATLNSDLQPWSTNLTLTVSRWNAVPTSTSDVISFNQTHTHKRPTAASGPLKWSVTNELWWELLRWSEGGHLMLLLTFCRNFCPTTLTTCTSCLTDVVLYFHDTKHESPVSALSTTTTGTGRPLLCTSHTLYSAA